MLKYLSILFIIIICFNSSYSQSWKRTRYELIGGVVVTSFMGDIGAPLNKGINKYFWLTPQSFRPGIHFGLRYKIYNRFSAKAILTTGIMSADDSYGAYKVHFHQGEPNPQGRGFNFRTFFAEFSVQGEYTIIKEKRKRNIYKNFRFKTQLKNVNIPTYLFIGSGLVYYNPKMRVGGMWMPMQESRDSGISKRNIAPVLIGGIGIKIKIDPRFYLGIEASSRFAFTDNIDDISNKNMWYHFGSKDRYGSTGGKYNDIYNFLSFNLTYKIKTGRNGLPRFRRIY